MKLDCVTGSELGVNAKWVVYDTDSGEILGFTRSIESEHAWMEAARVLAKAITNARSGLDVSAIAIPPKMIGYSR